MPKLREFEKSLPPGFRMQIGGEYDKTKTGFKNLAAVMVISIAAIYLALVFQFNNGIKPLLVLAAAPYGMVGAFAALWVMHEPFGFMAFLGVASLVGVIVSHSVVLFDFIEERHIEGDDFENAVIDAAYPPSSPCSDNSVRHCARAVPPRIAWWTALEAAVLRPDWRFAAGHNYHQAPSSSYVCDLRARSQDSGSGRPIRTRAKLATSPCRRIKATPLRPP